MAIIFINLYLPDVLDPVKSSELLNSASLVIEFYTK